MKFSSFLIMVVVLGGIGYYVYMNPDMVDKVMEFVENAGSGFNPELKGAIEGLGGQVKQIQDGDQVLVQFDYWALDTMDDAVYEAAVRAYEVFLRPVRVEGFYFGEPVLALVSDNPNEGFSFEDIREPEFMIESDLGIFDVLVEEIALGDKASITLQYLGAEEDFFIDFAAMAFVVVQAAPYITAVEIVYVKPGFCFGIETSTHNLLAYYADEVSGRQFLQSLATRDCSTHTSGIEPAAVGLVCSTDPDQAYQDYLQAYNKLNYFMSRGQGDTKEAQDAFVPYKFYKDCYESLGFMV
jgi:hypothetical protein